MYFDTNPDEFLASRALTTLLRRDHLPMFFFGDGKENGSWGMNGDCISQKKYEEVSWSLVPRHPKHLFN